MNRFLYLKKDVNWSVVRMCSPLSFHWAAVPPLMRGLPKAFSKTAFLQSFEMLYHQ